MIPAGLKGFSEPLRCTMSVALLHFDRHGRRATSHHFASSRCSQRHLVELKWTFVLTMPLFQSSLDTFDDYNVVCMYSMYSSSEKQKKRRDHRRVLIYSHTCHTHDLWKDGAKIINNAVNELKIHDTLKSSGCRDESEMMKIEWKLSGKLRAWGQTHNIQKNQFVQLALGNLCLL